MREGGIQWHVEFAGLEGSQGGSDRVRPIGEQEGHGLSAVPLRGKDRARHPIRHSVELVVGPGTLFGLHGHPVTMACHLLRKTG